MAQTKQSKWTFRLNKRSLTLGFCLYLLLAGGVGGWLYLYSAKTIASLVERIPSFELALTTETPVTPPVTSTETPTSPVSPSTPEAASSESKPSVPESKTIEQDLPPATTEQPASVPSEKPVSEEEKKPETSSSPVETETVTDKEHSDKTPIKDSEKTSITSNSLSTEGLSEKNQQGQILPRKAADGREPWRVFARPFENPENKPKIAIIVSDMGLSAGSTNQAINDLPPEVTLAFVPYANDLDSLIKKARDGGHETILSIPMEPETYPKDDPGPNALLAGLSKQENISRLHWALSRATGYVGIMNFMGSRFTADADLMAPVLDDLEHRGLIIIDSSSSSQSVIPSLSRIHNVPYATNDRFIDNIAARQSIDKQLQSLEEIAKRKGFAVGIAFPYPISFERIKQWSYSLKEKNIVLAPITALASEEIE